MTRGTLALILYPLAFGAMAVNAFFASLILSWIGTPVLTPWLSLLAGAILGLPATWAFAGHIIRLIRKADASA
jgi:hypothetical protein